MLYPIDLAASGTHRHPWAHGRIVFLGCSPMVRDGDQREILFDFWSSMPELFQPARGLNRPDACALTGIYHNLIRQWAETYMKNFRVSFLAA